MLCLKITYIYTKSILVLHLKYNPLLNFFHLNLAKKIVLNAIKLSIPQYKGQSFLL